MRLEQAREERLLRIFQFQFHKGAIRTLGYSLINIKLSLFQFHKGAIRTGIVEDLRTLETYFNSIKVRLELAAALVIR